MHDIHVIAIHGSCREDAVYADGSAFSAAEATATVVDEGWTVVPEAHGGWTAFDAAAGVWTVAVRPRDLCGDLRCDICNPATFICRQRLWAGGIEHAFAAAPFFRHQAMALCRRIDRQHTGPVLELEALVDMASDLAPDIDALHRAWRALLEQGAAAAGEIEDILRRRQQLSGRHRLAAALLHLADTIAAHWRFAPSGDDEAFQTPENQTPEEHFIP